VTDVELIEKKLAFIETCVRELRTLVKPAAIATDLREERFAAYSLQIAVTGRARCRIPHRMAGFRNVVVHGYQALDRAILADVVANRLGDLLDYVAAIRRGLAQRAKSSGGTNPSRG
jgi:uncharacterized protein YutE (UPF0331/DUF86 family)